MFTFGQKKNSLCCLVSILILFEISFEINQDKFLQDIWGSSEQKTVEEFLQKTHWKIFLRIERIVYKWRHTVTKYFYKSPHLEMLLDT